MGYAVFHRDAEGIPTLEDVASLDEALALVERSRNGDGPEDVRVFRELQIEVRTHYTVHVADDAGGPTEAAGPVEEPAAAPAPADPPVPVEAVTEVLPVSTVEDAPVPAAVSTDVAPPADGPSTLAADEDHELRQLLGSAPAEEPAAGPPASLPGAFPLAGPAVQPATVEVHANLEDEDAPKRHSLFGRGG